MMDLKKAGVSVHLLDRQAQEEPNSTRHLKSTKTSWKPLNILRYFYMRLPQSVTIQLMMFIVYPRRLRELLKKIRPDILHAWFVYDSGCIAALSRFRPVVVSSWGSDVAIDNRDPKRPLWLLEWANRLSLKRADMITATSKWLAQQTARYAPKGKTIHVIPFGIDCNKFNADKKKNNAGIITLGFAKHLLPKYGPDILIEAFGALAGKYPFLRLKMAGDGYMLSELERRTQAIGISNRVRFLGEIPHDKMPDFLSDVDIAVQPSIYESESFGVAALEASAMEIPVVSNWVGGVPECVEDGETGILVERKDVKALAGAISRLVEDSMLRKRMGRAGRKYVLSRYRWEDNVSAMEGLYKNLLCRFGGHTMSKG